MNAAKKQELISIDDYLAGEHASSIKREYLGGFVYAMAGARNAHNLIATNVTGALFGRLRSGPCRPYNSDTKIRIRLAGQTRFYYPDASVICTPNDRDDTFQDEPIVIVEVLSAGTRRLDQGEKKDAYLTIPSLQVYLLIEQESPTVVVHRRRGDGFVREVFEGLDAVVPLVEIDAELPLAEIYEAATFAPENPRDDRV